MRSMVRAAFREDQTKGKWVVAAVVLGSAIIAAALIYIVFLVINLGDSVKRVDALIYPVPQRVISQIHVGDYTGPGIRLGQEVKVEGTKCLDADHSIITFGVTTQSVINPGGINVSGQMAANYRAQGCVTKTYQNALYPELERRLARLFASGEEQYVVMKFTGFESPVDQHYTSVEWYTEDFRVYPPLGPLPGGGDVSPSEPAPTKETP